MDAASTPEIKLKDLPAWNNWVAGDSGENGRSKQQSKSQRLYFVNACFMSVLAVWVLEMQGQVAPGCCGMKCLELPLWDSRGPHYACIDQQCLKPASVGSAWQLDSAATCACSDSENSFSRYGAFSRYRAFFYKQLSAFWLLLSIWYMT